MNPFLQCSRSFSSELPSKACSCSELHLCRSFGPHWIRTHWSPWKKPACLYFHFFRASKFRMDSSWISRWVSRWKLGTCCHCSSFFLRQIRSWTPGISFRKLLWNLFRGTFRPSINLQMYWDFCLLNFWSKLSCHLWEPWCRLWQIWIFSHLLGFWFIFFLWKPYFCRLWSCFFSWTSKCCSFSYLLVSPLWRCAFWERSSALSLHRKIIH